MYITTWRTVEYEYVTIDMISKNIVQGIFFESNIFLLLLTGFPVKTNPGNSSVFSLVVIDSLLQEFKKVDWIIACFCFSNSKLVFRPDCIHNKMDDLSFSG